MAILLLGLAAALGGEIIRILLLIGALAGACLCFWREYRAGHPGTSAKDADSETAENPVPRHIEKEVGDGSSGMEVKVLGTAYSRQLRQEMETVIDGLLDHYIRLIETRIAANTIAIFFPSNDGGYRIRRFVSKCEFVNPKAIIYPGVGVIGSFLKDGLKQLHLHEIMSDSMTLYYYSQDAKIRSLMASPIVVGGVERGTVIVDSTEPKHFTDDDHDYLSAIARLCGETAYFAYVSNEHKLQYQRLAAMSITEKYFFQKHDVEAVLDKMAEIIPFAISCDRFTISLKNDADSAMIRRAWGPDADKLSNKGFSLKEKTLMSLLYAKNMCFFRDFTSDHYEARYADNEPVSETMGSFLAFPIGVDECKGGILLESCRREAFSDIHRALLSRLVTSAGLAIEKIQLIEQSNNLATHDGLTGLCNHRQFQKLLRDEITRSNRYKDPLTLVLCDIDLFKRVNDTHGHPFGDTVLRGVASTLQESIRDGVDIAARYGGEEFALILVKTDEKNARESAERIRQQIEKVVFHTHQGETVHVSMSFGIAVFSVHAKDIDGLVQKADKALYRAKQNGRNRVEVF
jgi:diguanylate cyclase (GGDEF)-like protein